MENLTQEQREQIALEEFKKQPLQNICTIAIIKIAETAISTNAELATLGTKDKANELVNTMLDKLYDNGSLSFKRILHARAVECAKVLADEMLHQYTTLNAELINGLYRSEKVVFWQAVRTELDYVQS